MQALWEGGVMPAYVVVNAADGTFRVHRRGCQDIYKTPNNGYWSAGGESTQEVIDREIADLNADHGERTFSGADFVVLPCTKEAR